ncbi:YopX family protein [Bacillus stercoris]|uniref:YopX family protein n=1 Tax=Bacillus stercoris TaxID=2054641 RepID=UPI002444CE21|nr:YopX family protein [Bacillus stercoris]WGE39845.1 YopX family protein [Bacillus stercoris]
MNTAYRVWDGEQMHYWDEPGMSLEIIGTHWFLRNMDNKGHKRYVTGSHEEGTSLMWGTGIREAPEEIQLGETIYAGHIVRQENLDPDLCGNPTLIGEVKMIEGQWCIVNDKKEECRPLFSETAIISIIGDIFRNPELLEGVENV